VGGSLSLLVWLHGVAGSASAKGDSLMWFAFWIGIAVGTLLGAFILAVVAGGDDDGR